MIVKLDIEAVKKLFEECRHQRTILVGLYEMVLPDWNRTKAVEHWPTCNKKTWSEISKMFMEFDHEHHPGVVRGGAWMNNGFSVADSEHLKDWEVDTSTCRLIMEDNNEAVSKG